MEDIDSDVMLLDDDEDEDGISLSLPLLLALELDLEVELALEELGISVVDSDIVEVGPGLGSEVEVGSSSSDDVEVGSGSVSVGEGDGESSEVVGGRVGVEEVMVEVVVSGIEVSVKVVPVGKSIGLIVVVSGIELVGVDSEAVEEPVGSLDEVDLDVEDVVRVIVGGGEDVIRVIVGGDGEEVVEGPVEVAAVEGGSVGLTVSDGEVLDQKDVPDVAMLLLPLSIDDSAATCLG
jgi:hypothetical protein